MNGNQAHIYELLLVDGRTVRIDGTKVHIEYEIINGDGTKEIKLSNRAEPLLVKDKPAKLVNNQVFDAYIINVMKKDCSGDPFNGVELFEEQRASFLTGIKNVYPFLEPRLVILALPKSSAVWDDHVTSYCLLLLGNNGQPEFLHFKKNLVDGLNRNLLSTGLTVTQCSSIRYGDKTDIIVDAGSIHGTSKIYGRGYAFRDYAPHIKKACAEMGLVF